MIDLVKAMMVSLKKRKGLLSDVPPSAFDGISLGHSQTSLKQGTTLKAPGEEAVPNLGEYLVAGDESTNAPKVKEDPNKPVAPELPKKEVIEDNLGPFVQ